MTLSSQARMTREERPPPTSRGESILRGLVVLSTIAACAVVWALVEKYHERPRAPILQTSAPEESIDSAALSRLAAMSTVPNARLHRIIAVLDPSSHDASVVASALTRLADETDLHATVSIFLAPNSGGNGPKMMSYILAGYCAKRQGRLIELLKAVAHRAAGQYDDWAALANESQVRSPADFVLCIIRREAMEDVSNGEFLVSRLHLDVLPAYLVDSTAIHGRISVDSVRARLLAKRM